MNERQMKSFLLAADQGSFTRAAQLAHISVPSFIQQINSFESNIGYKLFDRNKRGIILTEYGKVIYESSEKILQIYESALKHCEKLKADLRQMIRITYPADSFPPYIMDAYRSFSMNHPGINITFAPAETFLIPSLTSACASKVAVVVPSPATSFVLVETSLTS